MRMTWQQSQEQADTPDADIALQKRPKPKRKAFGNLRPEDYLQVQCVTSLRKWMRLHPGRLHYIVAQPEGKRSRRVQQIDKAKGLLGNPGHPEIMLMHSGPLRDVLIELKTKDGVMSEEQLDWQEWCVCTERRYVVVRSLRQFDAILAEFA